MSNGLYITATEAGSGKYTDAQRHCNFILCEGTDFVSSTASVEIDINASIIKKPFLPGSTGRKCISKTP